MTVKEPPQSQGEKPWSTVKHGAEGYVRMLDAKGLYVGTIVAPRAPEILEKINATSAPSETGATQIRGGMLGPSVVYSEPKVEAAASATPRTDEIAPHLNMSHSDIRDVAWALRKHCQMLERENFVLAAGQCCVKNGLLGDEGGSQYCRLEREPVPDVEAAAFWVPNFSAPEEGKEVVPADIARDLGRRLADATGKLNSNHPSVARHTDEAQKFAYNIYRSVEFQRTRAEAAERQLAEAKDYIKEMDRVIDDESIARSCISPLEDVKRAIAALKKRTEAAETALAEAAARERIVGVISSFDSHGASVGASPFVKVYFPVDNWDARDKFAAAIRQGFEGGERG